MKNIEQLIQEEAERYSNYNMVMSGAPVSRHKRFSMKSFIRGANLILSQWKEAERWRDVNEELPEETFETYVDGRYRYTTQSFLVKTVNGKYAISKRVQFMYHEIWEWNGSGTFKSSITHWKPMETITDKE